MKIPIIINHSIPYFKNSADNIAEGIAKTGNTPVILNNAEAREISRREHFEKCVFLDKDIPLGLSLEVDGTRLFNNIGSIELCSDKRRLNVFLKNDFPVPKTLDFPLTYFPDDRFFSLFTAKVCDELGLPVVAKFAFGSQGREVFLLENANDVFEFQKKHFNTHHLYQEFIASSKGTDQRVYVVGKNAVASIIRENKSDFRSNIAIGGTARKADILPETEDLCVNISNTLGLDFCGIDLLITPNGPMVCEVNANALFSALNDVCGIETGHFIADHVVSFRSGVL